MASIEAAALTEQEKVAIYQAMTRDLARGWSGAHPDADEVLVTFERILAERTAAAEERSRWCRGSTPEHRFSNENAPDVCDTCAARLADSRPVVSEGAIEAAVKVLRHLYGDHAVMPYYEARQIFTAALPHMGDGRGDAAHQHAIGMCSDLCELCHGFTKASDAAPSICFHEDTCTEDNCPCDRLSPTGDDT